MLEGRSLTPASFYNLVVNGGLEVWTAGAGPFTADGDQIADTWFISIGAGSSISVTQDSTNQDIRYSEFCAKAVYSHVAETTFFHRIRGPFVGSPIAVSVRVKTSTPNAVRIKIESEYSSYHTGSGLYETLILPVKSSPTSLYCEIAFNASGTFYIDNIMCVQGSGPIDFITFTAQDNLRRITDH